jgi:hypothetical protein
VPVPRDPAPPRELSLVSHAREASHERAQDDDEDALDEP